MTQTKCALGCTWAIYGCLVVTAAWLYGVPAAAIVCLAAIAGTSIGPLRDAVKQEERNARHLWASNLVRTAALDCEHCTSQSDYCPTHKIILESLVNK